MRVLVTGGLGFIGSHVVVELIQKNHNVLILDNLLNSELNTIDKVQSITGITPNYENVDLLDHCRLLDSFKRFRPEAVIHLAGRKSVVESLLNPTLYFKENVGGIINLLDAMDTEGCKNIIFSSSATVYGTLRYTPADEQHPLAPENPYGITKMIGEQLLASWATIDQSKKAVCLRYFNPIGAHTSGFIFENPKTHPTNIFPVLLEVATQEKEYLSIFGDNFETRDGTAERDFIHVMDLALAHLNVLENLERFSSIDYLNIGTGTSTSVMELVEAMELEQNAMIKRKFEARRPGDVGSCWADTSKYQHIFGGVRFRSVREACADGLRAKLRNIQ